MKTTAILLSGGIDSTALTYLHREEILFAITINYGQKSALREIEVSSKICKVLNITHEIINVNCSSLGSGEMCIADDASLSLSPISEWWPYRNQLLITLASMKAIKFGVKKLLFGAVKTDNRFVDGTNNFFNSINATISIQEGNLFIEAPAIKLTSVELVKKSKIPEEILYWAHSCHVANEPCGICNGCIKYMEVIRQLNNNT